MVKINERIPDFEAIDQNGNVIKSKDLEGLGDNLNEVVLLKI